MPRFCSQCGTQVPDGNAFCSNCGAPVAQPVAPTAQTQPNQQVILDKDKNVQQNAAQPNVQNTAPQPDAGQQFAQNAAPQPNAQQQFAQNGMPQQQFAQNGMQQQYGQPNQGGSLALKIKSIPKKNLMIAAGALAAVIVAIVLAIVLGQGSYKDPLNLYKRVLEKGDAKAYSKSYFDVDHLFDTRDDSYDREKTLEMRADFIDRYGSDAKVSYDILSCTPSSQKEIVQYNKAMALFGGKKYQIKKCYKLKVIFTYKGSLGADTDTKTFEVAQTKNGWKFLDTSPKYIYR